MPARRLLARRQQQRHHRAHRDRLPDLGDRARCTVPSNQISTSTAALVVSTTATTSPFFTAWPGAPSIAAACLVHVGAERRQLELEHAQRCPSSAAPPRRSSAPAAAPRPPGAWRRGSAPPRCTRAPAARRGRRTRCSTMRAMISAARLPLRQPSSTTTRAARLAHRRDDRRRVQRAQHAQVDHLGRDALSRPVPRRRPASWAGSRRR